MKDGHRSILALRATERNERLQLVRSVAPESFNPASRDALRGAGRYQTGSAAS
jgi:hypothetical protein